MNSEINKSELDECILRLADAAEFSSIAPLSIQSKSLFGNSLLHIAAHRNDVNAIRTLVAAGLDPNIQGDMGFTPLHDAAEGRALEAIKELLRLGADSSAEDRAGLTPIDYIDPNWKDGMDCFSL